MHNKLNTLLFSSGLCFHVVVCIFQAIFTPTFLAPEWSLYRILMLTLRAGLDWKILSIIHGTTASATVSAESPNLLLFIDHDAILERVLNTLGLSPIFFVVSAPNGLLGSCVAFGASILYVLVLAEEPYWSHHSYDTSVRL
jgi:hypothetical protein